MFLKSGCGSLAELITERLAMSTDSKNEPEKARRWIWVGGVAGECFPFSELKEFPAIVALCDDFESFQNSPYRGEFDQKKSMTFGQVRDVLVEISRLLKRQAKPQENPPEELPEKA